MLSSVRLFTVIENRGEKIEKYEDYKSRGYKTLRETNIFAFGLWCIK